MDGEDRTLGRTAGRGLRLGIDTVDTQAAARTLNRSGRRFVVVHATGDWHLPLATGDNGFFPKLMAELSGQGFETRLVRARSRPAEILADPEAGHVHLMVGAPPGYGANVLHVNQGYIQGFWYLDELGTHWNSSLRFSQFCADRVNRGHADYFFNGVAGWMLRHNVSISPQAERRPDLLEPARAVVFTQEIEFHRNRAHHLTNEQMIRTAAEFDRRKLVYVKPHPHQSKAALRDILAVTRDYQNIRVSEASVHDLIEKSDIAITQNSAAGFEALLQKKPVVTCAKSDFHAATLTARNAGDLREALEYGPEAMQGFAYEQFLYWFLGRNLYEPVKDNFAERAVARIRDKAFL
jgi:hypothetical protein